jgi:hypothetical protein
VVWSEVVGDPFGRAEEVRCGVVRWDREVLAVPAIEQHRRDAGSGAGRDVAPTVADHDARAIEVEVKDRGRLMKKTRSGLPTRAIVEVVVRAGQSKVEPEVLGDVLVVDLDRSGIDRPRATSG